MLFVSQKEDRMITKVGSSFFCGPKILANTTLSVSTTNGFLLVKQLGNKLVSNKISTFSVL